MSTIHQRRINSHVALLEFDNPPANALGRAMRAKLREALTGLDGDLSVRAYMSGKAQPSSALRTRDQRRR